MSRIRHSSRLGAAFLGFTATLAVAFFIGHYVSEGTHTGKTGKGGTGTKVVPMNISFPEGQLTPTNPVELSVSVNNTTTKTLTFHHLSMTVTDPPSCPASLFHVKAKGLNESWWNEALSGVAQTFEFSPGTHTLESANHTEPPVVFWLELEETGTDQSACEEASIAVTGKLTE